MLINNPVITGSFTVNGTNFITNTPTTGSNTFNGNQIISGSAIVTGSLQVTGSMTATGTITAQTLVVQTVTSSVVFSSGSNIFGNSLANTQQLTGSVGVTGSFNVVTTGTELQVNANGVTLGNALTDIHNVTGSLRITGSMRITGPSTLTDTLSGTNATLSGYLTAVAPSSIFYGMQIYGASGGARKIFVAGQSGYSDGFTVDYNGSTFTYGFLNGNVGIGTGSPASRLYVSTTAGATKAYDDLSKTNIMCFDNTSMAEGVGGSITFGGYKTGTSAGGNFAAIDGVKENGTAGNEAGTFRIWTANSAGVFGERMRISSTGASTFKVSSDSVFDILTLFNTSQTSAGVRLKFQNGYGDLAGIRVLQRDNGALADDGQMEFQMGNNASLSTVFTLRNDGLITTAGATSPYNFDPGGRVMYVNSLGQVGSTSSTRESKIHINPLTSVDYVMQLNPVSFYHRIQDTKTRTYTDEYFDEIKYGFIADEVEKVNLDLVFYNENEDGTKKLAGVEYMSMIAVLTKAIQELKAEIETLKNK